MENLKKLLGKPSVRGGLAGFTTALCLSLGCPSVATAQISGDSKAKIAEAISPSNDIDTTNAIDFNTARKNIEESDLNAEIDSKDKYKNEYFQFLDSLSDQEKLDLISEISMNSNKIKETIDDMLKNEDIVKAIKLGDIKTIQEKLEDIVNVSIENLVIGFVLMLAISFLIKRIKRGEKMRDIIVDDLDIIIISTIFCVRSCFEIYPNDCSEKMKVNNSLEKIGTANVINLDTTSVIDFNTARKDSSKHIENHESKMDIKSEIEKYRKEYFHYRESLSDQEKRDYIVKICKNSSKIKRIVKDMLDDEDIVKAMRLGDEKYIQKIFIDKMGGDLWDLEGLLLGLLFVAAGYLPRIFP